MQITPNLVTRLSEIKVRIVFAINEIAETSWDDKDCIYSDIYSLCQKVFTTKTIRAADDHYPNMLDLLDVRQNSVWEPSLIL